MALEVQVQKAKKRQNNWVGTQHGLHLWWTFGNLGASVGEYLESSCMGWKGQKENKREVAGSGGHGKEKANARVCGLFCFCFACLFVVVDFKNKSFLFFVEGSFKNGTQ